MGTFILLFTSFSLGIFLGRYITSKYRKANARKIKIGDQIEIDDTAIPITNQALADLSLTIRNVIEGKQKPSRNLMYHFLNIVERARHANELEDLFIKLHDDSLREKELRSNLREL